MLIRQSILNGDIENSGTIEATGIGNGIHINNNSIINGNIDNTQTISGGGSGITMLTSLLNGNITNSGMISGTNDEGINLRNSSTIIGNISNAQTGTISGGDTGIFVSSSTIHGNISNAGTITGGNYGIQVNSSVITGGITNSGTIEGTTAAIAIDNGSAVNNIDLIGGSRVIGAIEAQNTTVNILGGFTTEGTMDVGSVNIDSGALFNMANAITVQNAVTNAGTLNVGTTTQNITGNYTQSTGGVLRIGMHDIGAYGHLAATGAVDLSQSGAIDVNIASGAPISIGDVFSNVISGTSLTSPIGSFNVTDNSLLLNFAAAANGSSGVDLTAIIGTSIAASNAAAGNRGGAGAAQKLDEIIISSPTGDWLNVTNALFSLSTDQQVAAAVNQTVPVLTGATNSAAIKTMSDVSRIIQERQDSQSGLATGEDFQTSSNFWLKPFGSWAGQDTDKGVVGYDSNSYGIIAGADKAISEATRLGAAFSYSNSQLTSQDSVNRANVDSYLGGVYGSYALHDQMAVNAQMEAGYSSSDSTRYINFGGLNRAANGSYGGWNLHAGTGVGQSADLGSNTTITPQLRMDYFVVRNQSYDESGAGVLNLHVNSQTEQELIPALQVKADHSFTPHLSFVLNAGLGYNLLNDHNSVSANFAGGGGTFVTRGLESSPWVMSSGAGLTWKQSDQLDINARYDREDRGSSYDGQTVSLKLRTLF